MPLFEGKTPAERNKTIAALVFGLFAVILLGRMFFGSTGTTPTNSNRRQTAQRPAARGPAAPGGVREEEIQTPPQPVVVEKVSYSGGEPGRNIFAFAARPVAPASAAPVETATPPPTPTPTPPLVIAGLTPQSVYAQTGEFKLQVTGDKFTPESRVYVDGQDLPTQFAGPQQLSASVPASSITAPGNRQIVVRTPDGLLYSNPASLNVMQPPVPSYTFIGYISPQRGAGEKALLKDQRNELLSVQVNDIVGGRFRVTNISARTVDLVDKDLKIKHSLPYLTVGQPGGRGPQPGAIQPAPPADEGVDDEEP